MEFDKAKFMEKLKELVAYGKKKKSVLEYQEINDFFRDMPLDAEQMEKVFEYLECGDGYQAAIHTVVNALAIVSGIVCDGAKASCAAKIASSVDAALLGYNMYKCNQEFKGGDGIVMKDIETTIKGIGRLGKDGMRQTNEEIIRLMMS